MGHSCLDWVILKQIGTDMSNKKVLNHTEVAKLLGVGTTTLYRWIDDGKFSVEPITGTDPKLYSLEKVVSWTNS